MIWLPTCDTELELISFSAPWFWIFLDAFLNDFEIIFETFSDIQIGVGMLMESGGECFRFKRHHQTKRVFMVIIETHLDLCDRNI